MKPQNPPKDGGRVESVPESPWLAPLSPGQLPLQQVKESVANAKSRERSLAGLAEDFRYAGRQAPRLWHILFRRDARGALLDSFSPISDLMVHWRGDWLIRASWAHHDHGLVGMYFGEDPDSNALARFQQLARCAGHWARSLLATPGPSDLTQHWLMLLHRFGITGDRRFSAHRYRQHRIDGSSARRRG